ncbi:MAG: hypothetical protein HGA54_00850 [Actinobacteria bacterium]|nr:hypothetical protein [Actinomycetota bacterium]
MSWIKHDVKLWNKQKLPPERKYVLVMTKSNDEASPNPIYVGYLKYAAGDKYSPYFIVPGYEGEPELHQTSNGFAHLIHVVAWCDCMNGFAWPMDPEEVK